QKTYGISKTGKNRGLVAREKQSIKRAVKEKVKTNQTITNTTHSQIKNQFKKPRIEADLSETSRVNLDKERELAIEERKLKLERERLELMKLRRELSLSGLDDDKI
ncbi:13866_t:CDS:2, partial [Dentiscutata heterogama]